MLPPVALSLPLAIEGADWQQIIILLLFLFFGLGKTIVDKVRGAKPSQDPRRRPRPLPQAPPTVGGAISPDGTPMPISEPPWEEPVAIAEAQRPEPEPLPAPLRAADAPLPLGLDLMQVEENLPSRHEEMFESHAGSEGRTASAPMHHVAARRASKVRVSHGSRLHASLGDREAWRRAIVVSEALGTPLGLRTSEQLPGLR